MKVHRAGFTLIEILVVIIVIGILVAVLAPGMFNTRNITDDAAVQSALISAGQAQERYAMKYNRYYAAGQPESLTAFGFTPPAGVVLQYISASASTYCIQGHPTGDSGNTFSIVPGENVLGSTCAAR